MLFSSWVFAKNKDTMYFSKSGEKHCYNTIGILNYKTVFLFCFFF